MTVYHHVWKADLHQKERAKKLTPALLEKINELNSTVTAFTKNSIFFAHDNRIRITR